MFANNLRSVKSLNINQNKEIKIKSLYETSLTIKSCIIKLFHLSKCSISCSQLWFLFCSVILKPCLLFVFCIYLQLSYVSLFVTTRGSTKYGGKYSKQCGICLALAHKFYYWKSKPDLWWSLQQHTTQKP